MQPDHPFIKVKLPGGYDAVYQVQPHHVPRLDIPESRDWPIWYGKQIAHADKTGAWFKPGNWIEITDPKIVAILDKVSYGDIATPEAA